MVPATIAKRRAADEAAAAGFGAKGTERPEGRVAIPADGHASPIAPEGPGQHGARIRERGFDGHIDPERHGPGGFAADPGKGGSGKMLSVEPQGFLVVT